MMPHLTVISRYWPGCILVLLLPFLLQGCFQKPLVEVKEKVQVIVGECSKDGMKFIEDDDGPKGCMGQPYNLSATGFWNKDTQKVIVASDNKTCSASQSQKCQNAGLCWNITKNKLDNCTTNYTDTPQQGSCFCTCGRL